MNKNVLVFFNYVNQNGCVNIVFGISVTSKKSPNVYKSCPKIISQEKSYILTTLQVLPNNVRELGKLIVAKVFKSCQKYKKMPNLVTLFGIQAKGQIGCPSKVKSLLVAHPKM